MEESLHVLYLDKVVLWLCQSRESELSARMNTSLLSTIDRNVMCMDASR